MISATGINNTQQAAADFSWHRETARAARQPQQREAWTNTARGFTFIELMIVILILGVLVGSSVPSLSAGARQFAFSQKISRIQALLRYLQRHAVAQQRAYRVVIEARGEEKRVEWLNEEAGPESWQAWTSSLLTATLGAASLEWRNQTCVAIIFYPNGTASSSEIELQDSRGSRAIIRTSLSGEILWEKPT